MQLCQSRNSLFCLIVIMLYNTPLRYVLLFLTLCVALNFSSLVRPTTLNFIKGNTFFFYLSIAQTAAEYDRRRENFFKELEIVFADVVWFF